MTRLLPAAQHVLKTLRDDRGILGCLVWNGAATIIPTPIACPWEDIIMITLTRPRTAPFLKSLWRTGSQAITGAVDKQHRAGDIDHPAHRKCE